MKKLLAVFLILMLLSGCAPAPENKEPDEPSSPADVDLPNEPDEQGEDKEPIEPDEEKPEPLSATLLAAGDNLIHNTIYAQAERRATTGQYDFLPVYETVAGEIAEADIAFINQETILGSDAAPVSSYPQFCSPTQLGDQLISMGFDVFTHSNNHVFDVGEAGAAAALEYWARQEDVIQTGLFQEGESTVRTVEQNGITFAFVAFTYGTNGLSLPEGSPYYIILADDYPVIREQVELAKEAGDVVVASIHWGIEGSAEVSDKQREIANYLAEWGVDIIIGTHPHVLQPIEVIKQADGRETFCVYSLGNFVSHQSKPANMIGGLLKATVTVDPETGAVKTQGRFVPTITQYEAGGANVRIIPFRDYTPVLAGAHGINGKEPFTYEYIQTYLEEIIGTEYLAAQ